MSREDECDESDKSKFEILPVGIYSSHRVYKKMGKEDKEVNEQIRGGRCSRSPPVVSGAQPLTDAQKKRANVLLSTIILILSSLRIRHRLLSCILIFSLLFFTLHGVDGGQWPYCQKQGYCE